MAPLIHRAIVLTVCVVFLGGPALDVACAWYCGSPSVSESHAGSSHHESHVSDHHVRWQAAQAAERLAEEQTMRAVPNERCDERRSTQPGHRVASGREDDLIASAHIQPGSLGLRQVARCVNASLHDRPTRSTRDSLQLLSPLRI
jgi:hypothetical protein